MTSGVPHTWNLSSGRETEGTQGVHGRGLVKTVSSTFTERLFWKNLRWRVREGDISCLLVTSNSPECTHKQECLQTYKHTHTPITFSLIWVYTHTCVPAHTHSHIHHICLSPHIGLHTSTCNTQSAHITHRLRFLHRCAHLHSYTHTTRTSIHTCTLAHIPQHLYTFL